MSTWHSTRRKCAKLLHTTGTRTAAHQPSSGLSIRHEHEKDLQACHRNSKLAWSQAGQNGSSGSSGTMQTPKHGQTLRVGETGRCPKGPSQRRFMDQRSNRYQHDLEYTVSTPSFWPLASGNLDFPPLGRPMHERNAECSRQQSFGSECNTQAPPA